MSISEQQLEQRREWMAKCRRLLFAGFDLVHAYENLTMEDNQATADGFPFDSSFDEQVYAWQEWLSDMEEKWGL
jgi:hypothetical protein